MRQPGTRSLAGILTFVLVAASAAAQDAASEASKAPAPAPQAKPGSEGVYTTDYLKKRFSEPPPTAPSVYTNRDLTDKAGEPAPATATFTNEDLAQRFGVEEPAPAAAAPTPAPNDVAAGAAGEAPKAVAPRAPALSQEQRAQHIASIDSELERLERRLLAIQNPLLAGTVPPTPEERQDEAGLDNATRLLRTEAKIDELKAALEKLRAEPAQPE